MREYDYAIVNDHVPLAAERAKRVIERTFPRRSCRRSTRICYQAPTIQINCNEYKQMMLKPSIDTL